MLAATDQAATREAAEPPPGHHAQASGIFDHYWPASLQDAIVPCAEHPHIHVCRDYGTLRQIGRLRYRQYVQTQKKGYASAVLDPDCLIELPDFSGVNVYARDATGLTAAMRVGSLTDAAHPSAAMFAEAARKAHIEPRLTIVCTRLVANANHAGRHAGDCVRFVRLQTVTAGYRYCVMQTAERLVPYFQRFGFKPAGFAVHDEVAGPLHTMILDTKRKPVQGRRSDDKR